ncbi:MAG: response regulator [Armatimonadetes bacterium]|nr:response regulator [Armatimonadota bacterium]
MNDLLYRIWSGPKWLHYALAVFATLLAGLVRVQLSPVLGGNARFIFFTVPIALAAFVGGLVPGLLASAIALWIGFLWIGPSRSVDPFDTWLQVVSICVTWLFLCVVCDLMRIAAVRYRKAERERDTTRQQLDAILDGVSDGFFAVDNQWHIVHTNRAFREIVGRDNAEVGAPIWELTSGARSPFYRSMFETAKRNGDSLAIDVPEPGGSRWFHLRAFPNADGMFVYVQDVTTRKQLELDRERILANERRARSEAEAASRIKDEFVATLSHELRSPLTTILGWSELLRKRQGLDSTTVEGLGAIERSTRLQAQLIDDLLDMSRIQSGKLRLDLQIVDLGEIVAEAVRSAKLAADNKSISIELRTEAGEVFSRGDPSRLTQIVMNLVSNSVKFTPRNGHIEVQLDVEGSMAVVRVTDDGEGIDPKMLHVIFDRFRQADSSTTRKHGGLGLGLSIVKQLTELHGGTVEAMSDGAGKGTTMTVRLPVAAYYRHADTGMGRSDRARPDLSGAEILVVDDDESTRGLLGIVLMECGATVRSAASAQEAIELLGQGAPDVLLSDIGMPDMDGLQMIARIRAMDSEPQKTVPAIALTAFAREKDRAMSKEAGYDTHLSKPVDADELIDAIAELLASRKWRAD